MIHNHSVKKKAEVETLACYNPYPMKTIFNLFKPVFPLFSAPIWVAIIKRVLR